MLVGFPPFYDENPLDTYKKIISGKYKFAPHMTKEARHLLKGLLQVKSSKRLGIVKGEAELIKNHPFYQGKIDFKQLYAKKIHQDLIPYIPKIYNNQDLSNFDNYDDEDGNQQDMGDIAEPYDDTNVTDKNWADQF